MVLPGWRKRPRGRKAQGAPARRLRPIGHFEPLETREMLSQGSIELGPQTGYNDQPYIEVELIS